MGSSRIMVVVGERQWTLQAIHLACAVAQSNDSKLVLLHMVPVRQTWFLGTDLGLVDFTFHDELSLAEYAQIPTSYGVCLSVCVFQYAAFVSGLLYAADQFDPQIVFALPPRRLIPLWRKLEVAWLRRALSNRHRALYTLEEPDDVIKWAPLITLAPKAVASLTARQPELAALNHLRPPKPRARPKSR